MLKFLHPYFLSQTGTNQDSKPDRFRKPVRLKNTNSQINDIEECLGFE